MLHLSSGDLHGSLVRCFQLMAGVVREKSGEAFGAAEVNGRLSCQASMALASEVLSFIDRELSEEFVNYYRWVYCPVDESKALYFLSRYCWSENLSLLDGRRVVVRDSLASMRMLAPMEAKHRVFNDGKSCYSRSALAEMLGIDLSSFKRSYAKHWDLMVNVVIDLGLSSSRRLEQYIDYLVRDELDALPEVDQVALRKDASDRLKDFSGEIKSVAAERVIFSGEGRVEANAARDEEVTQEDVEAYLARGGKINLVESKKAS